MQIKATPVATVVLLIMLTIGFTSGGKVHAQVNAPPCQELATQLATAEKRINSVKVNQKANPTAAAELRAAQAEFNALKRRLAQCNAEYNAQVVYTLCREAADAQHIPAVRREQFFNDCLKKHGITRPIKPPRPKPNQPMQRTSTRRATTFSHD